MNERIVSLLQDGLQLLRQGALSDAMDRYSEVLRFEPSNRDALYYLAAANCQQGRMEDGLALCRRLLASDPNQARVHNLMGKALHMLRKPEEALQSFESAIAVQSDLAEAHGNRGNVLAELGRNVEALESYDRALELQPDSARFWCNRGTVLQGLHRHPDAIASYDRALAHDPALIDAQHNRASALAHVGQFPKALAGFEGILTANPEDVEALAGRGEVLLQIGRPFDALVCFQLALAIRPGADEFANLAKALQALGRLQEALDSTERALSAASGLQTASALNLRGTILTELKRTNDALSDLDKAQSIDPGNVAVINNRGTVLEKLSRTMEALADYDRALNINPNYVPALVNRALLLVKTRRYGDALLSADRALGVRPGHAEALYVKGNALQKLDRWDDAIVCYEQVLKVQPTHRNAFGALALCFLFTCNWKGLAGVDKEWANRLADGQSLINTLVLLAYPANPSDLLAHNMRMTNKEISPGGPLIQKKRGHRSTIRVAYVSGDFRRHPVGYLVPGLLERHDRAHFEVVGVSFGPAEDSEVRARIVRACDRFEDVAMKSDRDIAQMLLDMDVDIAVDLMGYTESSRPDIFAYRPAPIQVSYLGFLGTMGAEFMDYIVADRVTVPMDEQPFYSEKIVHVPNCFMVNDDKLAIAARAFSRRELGLPADGFVFCSFNNAYKLRAPMFDIWMRLLRSISGSVLWLAQVNDAMVTNLRNEATERGVDPGRLIFAPYMELSQNLARLRCADLFLDTVPYNAGATASNALWAGVPMITCIGDTFAGRMAASMLQAIGLPELVTASLQDYEALASKLATDPSTLASIRRTLEQNRLARPLFDTDRFRRHIEAAYATMWEMHQRGEAPRSFAVEQR